MTHRRPDKVQVELHALCHELQDLYKSHKNRENSNKNHDKDRQRLLQGIGEIIDILREWDSYMRSDQELEAFHELQQQIFKVQEVFQLSDDQQFDKQYQEIIQQCLSSPHQVLHDLASYLKKYQNELSVYLEWGMEKTTSLLEQVFQRLKKTTSNNRGGKDKESMERFARTYQFFWNVEPIQLRGERIGDKRSPITRMGEKTLLPLPLDLSQRWWYWLSPMAYQVYRKRVHELGQQRRLEWNHLQERREPKLPSTLKTNEERPIIAGNIAKHCVF